jgi:hypothetical protein
VKGQPSSDASSRSGFASISTPARLGLNQGAYRGETIDIEDVLAQLAADARRFGWSEDPISTIDGLTLPGWIRRVDGRGSGEDVPRIYVSAGIHGDEPAGPLAARELVLANDWPEGVEIWLCPCLNPTGFLLKRRENVNGFDLNRQYLHKEAAEVRAHVDWLMRQPNFDVCLCLHEDWESHGFYLYELNPDGKPSQAEKIIQEVSEFCPIDSSPSIEGRPAVGGIIYPSVDPASRPQWPEAFFLLIHKTRHAYTLEAPSDFSVNVRVQSLVRAVRAVARSYEKSR